MAEPGLIVSADGGEPAVSVAAGDNSDLLLPACAVALVGADSDQWLQLQKALLADALDVHQLFDLFGEDSQLNVYRGELEVRPPGAPTTDPDKRRSAVGSPWATSQ